MAQNGSGGRDSHLDEVETYRAAAKVVLALSEAQVRAEVEAGRWMEVQGDDQDL